MKRSVIFAVIGILGMLFGLAMLIVPSAFMGTYGVTLDTHTSFITRYYGAALFSFGLIFWLIRKVDSLSAAFKAATTGGFMFGLLGVIVSIWNVLSVPATIMHWVNVTIFVLVAIATGYLYFKKTE